MNGFAFLISFQVLGADSNQFFPAFPCRPGAVGGEDNSRNPQQRAAFRQGLLGGHIQIGGGKHLRLIFSKGDNSFQALLFGVTAEQFCFECGDLLDLAVTVSSDIYNGETRLSVQVKALRMNGTDDVRLFGEISCFNDYMAGRQVDAEQLLPSREETGSVYRLIASKPVTGERIKYLTLNTVGYAKCEISLMVLSELGLIQKDGTGFYKITGAGRRTELANSAVYRNLLERSGKQ